MPRTLHNTTDQGLWRQVRTHNLPVGRPCLFLDRDGVIVEETHYLSRAADVRIIEGAAEAIRAANRLDVAVVIVTNQAGIGRGLYDWSAFAEVQAEILARLTAGGGGVDAVYACAYHEQGLGPLQHNGDHPWRKPQDGMLRRAATDLKLDLNRSWIVGDRASDLGAGRKAGLRGGTLVATGYGARPTEAAAALALITAEFAVSRSPSLAAVVAAHIFDGA